MSKHTSRTQMQSHFAQAVHADIQRSVFHRNNTVKTTFNAGDLVPIYIDEVLPGDTFDMDMNFISRLTTPIFPTMDVLNLDFYAFFVPNRIVWNGWEELMGENKTGPWVPAVKPALVPVILPFGNPMVEPVPSKSIGDYYGLPVGLDYDSVGGVNILPFRGYGLIWNEWFRDQNLQAPIAIDKGNSDLPDFAYMPWRPLFKVNKKHDYFTSCLPAPQKGESALIPIELNDLIPVLTGSDHNLSTEQLRYKSTEPGLTQMPWPYGIFGSYGTNGQALASRSDIPPGGAGASARAIAPNNLWADGRGMSLNATTISELRTAFQIQKLFERDARGGTRYVEMLKAHFGVDAQDYRLQRPEFLGHAHEYVGIQQVAQTSSTDSTSPQGNLSAFSYTSGSKTLFKKSFVEHGFVHIFAVARQPKSYQQGLERFWNRRERFDFYMPALAHISEQPVYNREIYVSSDKTENDGIFGYNEAWADYRYKPNRVTGQFRTDVPNSLSPWIYADWYTSRPFLSADWIQDNSKENVDDTIAIPSGIHDQIIMDVSFRCKATRPMPVHSIPGLVDHF